MIDFTLKMWYTSFRLKLGGKNVNRQQILVTIIRLSKVNGFYNVLKKNLSAMQVNEPERYESLMQAMEAHNFQNEDELCMYLET